MPAAAIVTNDFGYVQPKANAKSKKSKKAKKARKARKARKAKKRLRTTRGR
jgi:hypothetical protein